MEWKAQQNDSAVAPLISHLLLHILTHNGHDVKHLLELWSSPGEYLGQPAPSTLASELQSIVLTAGQEHFLQDWIWRNQTHPGTKEQHQSPARDKSWAPGPVQSNFHYLHLWTTVHVCLPLLWRILFFIFNQNFLCCNLFPLPLPLLLCLHKKAYSVTIHHNFGESNDICPSPFLIKAEQTSHSSALVCHAFLPSSTGLTALCQGPPYSRKTQMGYSTPASNCDIPSQLPKRGEQSFPSTCWIILLLTQPCVETWKRTALHHSYDQRNRSAKDPLPEWWGDSSLLLGEPQPHHTLPFAIGAVPKELSWGIPTWLPREACEK